MFTFYEVGGKVRDELLGLKSKDVDYVTVPNYMLGEKLSVEQLFRKLEKYLIEEKFEIFLITPDCYTIRARFPVGHIYSGVADFVMARKEVGYIEGTRTPILEPGTLYDDLERRDFTVNALAKDHKGNIIDFFGGREDLVKGILRTPLNCYQTFDDDPLRILRALRFKVTKKFTFSADIHFAIHEYDYKNKMFVVSKERIYEELRKMFEYDTLETLKVLNDYFTLKNYIFKEAGIKLKPVI